MAIFLISNVYFQNLTSWCDLSSFILLPFFNLSIDLYLCIDPHTLFFLLLIPFSYVEFYYLTTTITFIEVIIMYPISSLHIVLIFFYFLPQLIFCFITSVMLLLSFSVFSPASLLMRPVLLLHRSSCFDHLIELALLICNSCKLLHVWLVCINCIIQSGLKL